MLHFDALDLWLDEFGSLYIYDGTTAASAVLWYKDSTSRAFIMKNYRKDLEDPTKRKASKIKKSGQFLINIVDIV